MSATHAIHDTRTLLRRNLVRARRYPAVSVSTVMLPALLLLLFVFVLGATLGAGIGAGTGDGRRAYASYVTPTILLLTVLAAGPGTSIAVATDMATGMIARLKTMAIWRPSVLASHVVAGMVLTLAAVAVLLPVAFAAGFRPTAGVAEWLGVVGLLTLVTLGVTWLCVAFGLYAKTVEGASNLPLLLLLLPFLGSGFVPTQSLPAVLAGFAEHQPFTPIADTLRALLLGVPQAGDAIAAVAWSVALAAVGYLWSVRLYDRRTA